MSEIVKQWEKIAKDMLVGKRVIAVRYMNAEEVKELGWHCKTLIICLKGDDGKVVNIYASADDEGNEAGAIHTTDDNHYCLPVIH